MESKEDYAIIDQLVNGDIGHNDFNIVNIYTQMNAADLQDINPLKTFYIDFTVKAHDQVVLYTETLSSLFNEGYNAGIPILQKITQYLFKHSELNGLDSTMIIVCLFRHMPLEAFEGEENQYENVKKLLAKMLCNMETSSYQQIATSTK